MNLFPGPLLHVLTRGKTLGTFFHKVKVSFLGGSMVFLFGCPLRVMTPMRNPEPEKMENPQRAILTNPGAPNKTTLFDPECVEWDS